MKRWAGLGVASIVAASAVKSSVALLASPRKHGRMSIGRYYPPATHLVQGNYQTARKSRLSSTLSEVHQTVVESPSQQTEEHTANKEEVRLQVGLREEEAVPVPSKWSQALRRFFLEEIGPPLVVLSICGFAYARFKLSSVFTVADTLIFTCSIMFWWIQEYFFHRVLLHSPFAWIGKSIHQNHHDKTYFHVSVDPPALILGWLFAAHLILKSILPWGLCLSATIGYAGAGLAYEWSHYIVHTKVKPTRIESSTNPVVATLSKYYSSMRDNHIRHHRIDDGNWFAFSVPAMDDAFYTNPRVEEMSRRVSQRPRVEK
mmetsp:Transcript_8129/g.18686  ORF Transcript_8129/g.18686 Transcript_8129/m.18686 type:complete len:316 (+) Transcript_8129:118-1065(+)